MIENFAPAYPRRKMNAKKAKFLLFQRLLRDDSIVFPIAMKPEVMDLVKECVEKYGVPPKARILFK